MAGEDAIWFLAIFLEVGVIVTSLVRKSFTRYLALNTYMGASAFVGVLRYVVLRRYGIASYNYFYAYYYSDALLTICLYFTLIGLYSLVLKEMKSERYIRFAAVVLLAGTALFAYAVVAQQMHAKIVLTKYVVELSQDLYFVGVVLTYILWGAILKLRQTRTRLVQLVLSLGVYFSAFAANYALRNLYPSMHLIWENLPPVMAFLLPAAWAYAFLRLPEDAHLSPAQLTAVPQ